MPRLSSVRPMFSLSAPSPAAMLCAPKAVTNPAAYSGVVAWRVACAPGGELSELIAGTLVPSQSCENFEDLNHEDRCPDSEPAQTLRPGPGPRWIGPGRPTGGNPRLPRPERRREIHHAPRPPGPGQGHLR